MCKSFLLWSEIVKVCVPNILAGNVFLGGNRTGWFYDMNIGCQSLHVLGIVWPRPGGGEEGGLEHVHHSDQHGHKEQADEGDDDGKKV